jgi:putative transposase
VALAIQFGHARFTFNWALGRRKENYQLNGKGLNYYVQADELKDLKRKDDTIWLKQGHSQVLQQKLIDLDQAYVNFFEGRAEYPTFKSKRNKQSIRYPQGFKLEGQSIYLSKVGWVRLVLHRPLEGEMKSATVTKTKSGRYFVSIQCETEIDDPIYEGPHVGVDMGLNHFATLSTGEKIDNPRHLLTQVRKTFSAGTAQVKS